MKVGVLVNGQFCKENGKSAPASWLKVEAFVGLEEI